MYKRIKFSVNLKGQNWFILTKIETKLNQKNTTTNWHMALASTRGIIVTWHVDNFFEIKKI